ncbi:hypothetical protein [Haloferax sp. Atlit-4N]|uniref:hypothetical protein n=1 Tax=Haloferax sp. Atlit-4N TaxID=2077206 RepID=UPI0011C07A64|nr:hypothetical protein [Haloferax sp. Atlit-4N]
MTDDFFSMAPKSPDQQLRELVSEFVEKIQNDEDFEKEVDGELIYSTRMGMSVGHDMFPYVLSNFYQFSGENDPANQIRKFVKSEYNESLTDSHLKQILYDAFGPMFEYKVPNVQFATNRLISKLAEREKGRELSFFRGVIPQKGGVLFGDYSIKPKYESDVIDKPMGGHYPVTFKELPIAAHLVAERDITYHPNNLPTHINTKSQHILKKLFELYFATKVGSNGAIICKYGHSPEGHISDPDDPPMSPAKLNAHDSKRIERLLSLISSDSEKRLWKKNIDMPLSHLCKSIDSFNSFHESVTFSVIGLESLYKHYTDGGKSSRDVQRYAGYLISLVAQKSSAIEVRDVINDAYGTRNGWVHGGSSSAGGEFEPSNEQRNMWDYLRTSIVIFAWLKENTNLSENDKVPLDSALIDENSRQELESELDKFKLNKYLSIKI